MSLQNSNSAGLGSAGRQRMSGRGGGAECVATKQENSRGGQSEIAFETQDFYLACFLGCTRYDFIDLRAEGLRKVFVFRDRPTRSDDTMVFYGNVVIVPPLTFSSIRI